MEADAGGVVTVAFSVVNHTAIPYQFQPGVTMPEGWRVVTPPAAFEVGARARSLRLVSVRIPAATRPGMYPVRFNAHASTGDQAGATAQVVVRPRFGLRLDVMDAPRYVQAGVPFIIRLLLANTGNAPALVHLRLSGQPFPARLDVEDVTVAPGAAEPITIEVMTRTDLTIRTTYTFELAAHLDGASTATATARGQVLVIPGEARMNALQPTAPIALRLFALGSEVGVGQQAELEAAVPLSADSTHRAEVLLRTAPQYYSSFAQPDLYQARYIGPSIEVLAGDGIYGLTSLTAPSRYGVGAGARATFGRIGATAFMRTNRRSFFPETQGGASVEYDTGRFGSYAFNASAGSGEAAGAAASLRAALHSTEVVQLDAEVGLAGDDGVSEVFSLEAAGRHGETRYHARFDHVGPDHPNYSTGFESRAAGFSSRIAPDLAFATSYRSDRRWVDGADGTLENSLFGIGVNGRRRFGERTLQGAVDVEQADYLLGLGEGRIDREQLLLRVRGGFVLPNHRFSAIAEVARLTDQVTGDLAPFRRLLLEYGWQSAGQHVYSQLDIQQGTALYLTPPGVRWLARAGGREQIGRITLSADLGGGIERSTSSTIPYGTAWFSLSYSLPREMRLHSEMRAQLTDIGRPLLTSNYRISLEVPLAAPRLIRFRSQMLEGVIVDVETGRGIPDVLVHLGNESALTGADGRFVFPRPTSGAYYLHIDRVSLGMDRVPAVPMPYLIDVPADGVMDELRIPVTRRASLSGRVRLMDIHGSGLLADTLDAHAPIMAVVEATSGDHRLRRLCTRDGRFTFEDVPPGRWTLRLVQSDAPEDYRLEREAYEIDLVDRAEVDLRLLPRQRRIRLIGTGSLGAR